MVRCFIGIMAPENLKNKIVSIQDSLKKLPIECKMVEAENLHICLSFLGEVEESKIEGMSKKLDSICERYEASAVEISGIKFIPNENYFRVLALDCHNSLLKTLGMNIEQEIGGDAKPPHLTLCRVKNIREKGRIVAEIKKIDSYVGDFTVSSVQIIKSQLQKSGPTYTVLRESKLR